MQRLKAGIDLGSVSVKLTLLDDGRAVSSRYRRHYGRPGEALALMLSEMDDLTGLPCAVTGSGSGLVADLIGARPVNEVVALSSAVGAFLPEVRSVVEMGGQDSKLLLFREGADGGSLFDDFAMNSVCAAGTGSFLDQQATRLGLDPESMGREAELCQSPPRIAGRCSVFAKSDMIHLQQIGTPVRDIVAGLCFAVARNFKSSIASGKEFRPPVAFVGGVAANSGMVRAFREVLGEESSIFVPEGFSTLAAAGAALAGREDSLGTVPPDLIKRLGDSQGGGGRGDVLPPLAGMESEVPGSVLASAEVPEVYLGIDVGSISTNVVALDATGSLVAKSYLMTAGRPLEAVKRGLAEVSQRLPDGVRVLGVGTTGSGRYMVGDFVGADLIRNEITAQARAAVEIDPEVDTIFEIGGQDSKYISLRDGRVVDFEMNKVCAAGTGSFLEEQAERLGLEIRDFGDAALESPAPAQLGERCTVFMESDVVSHQASGTDTEDIVGGLCYSIVRNYLHRVVGERRVGGRIFFQGGTAYNRGVVAAFNAVLAGRGRVTVPPHHDVTGAIGAALLARERTPAGHRAAESAFRGFSLAGESYSQSSFVCAGCSNSCEIHRVELADGRKLFYGGRCERYERDSGGRDRGRNHFPRRLRMMGVDDGEPSAGDGRPTVGLPRALWFWERYPFFRTFFVELGMRPVVSSPSNAEIVHRGVENVAAETCFPVKIAHGHVLDLLDRGVDYLFLPSIQRAGDSRGFSENYSCPFVQASPYVLDAGLGLSGGSGPRPLSPVIDFSSRGSWRSSLVAMARRLGVSGARARRACSAAAGAQEEFESRLRRAGRTALSEIEEDEVALVVVARPYNSADTTVSIDIPEKLSRLGARVIPMDFLDLPLERAPEVHRNMYWHYGQRILAAALAIREDPRLNAVYLTNFGCGPDSFIQHVFEEVMGDKPYLALEIDEHAADAGIITRCEAFLDSLRGRRREGTSPYRDTLNTVERPLEGRTLWIPLMSDATRMAAAAVRRRGVDARAIPPTCRDAVSAGREATTGKECYPSIITSGNMLRILQREDPDRTAFFMGTASGPCRFGQYCSFQRMLLRRKGFGDVPVLTSSSSGSYGGVPGLSGPGFQLDLLRGIAAADVLHRGLLRVRPYEGEPGAADGAYGRALGRLTAAMEAGGELTDVLEEAAEELAAVSGGGAGRPLVHVFGEIYVRNDPYANGYTADHIERLGGEVLPTPLVEWFEYVSHSHVRRSLRRGRLLSALRGKLKGLAVGHVRSRMEAPFAGLLSDRPALEAPEVLRAARPYMTENPGGEAVLCVGAPLAYLSRGAIDGAVNIFPFTCLPGTIVTAISKRLRREHPELPWINLAFDGQEDTDNLARLEAFMHQVRGRRAASAGRASPGVREGAERGAVR